MLKKDVIKPQSVIVLSVLAIAIGFFIWSIFSNAVTDGRGKAKAIEKVSSFDGADSGSLVLPNKKDTENASPIPCSQLSPFSSGGRQDCTTQVGKSLSAQEKKDVYVESDTSVVKSALVNAVLNAVPGSGAASAKAFIQCSNASQDASADFLSECDELRSNIGVILLVLKIQADKGDADAALYKAKYYLTMLRRSADDDKNRAIYQGEFERMSSIASANHSDEVSKLKEALPK